MELTKQEEAHFRGRTHTHFHTVRAHAHANSTYANTTRATNAFPFSSEPSTKEVLTNVTTTHLNQMESTAVFANL